MGMRRSALAPAAASLAVLLSLGACAPAQIEEPRTAAIVMPALEGRFQDVADVLEERLAADGFEVEVHGTDGDIPAQVTVVDELLGEGVDALVVWPIDGTSLTPVVEDAPAGTLVVAIGGLVYDTGRLDAFVGFDAASSAEVQLRVLAEALPADALPADAPLTIELFVGSPDDAATASHHRALLAGLESQLDAGTVVVGSGETALTDVTTLRGNAETAASRMARILREDYAEGAFPDAVVTTSDEIARGVSQALLDAGAVPGEGFPVVTGRGAELRSLVAMLEGRQHSTQVEDPRALAEAAARLVLTGPAPGAAEATVDNGAAPIAAVLVRGVPVLAADIDELVIGTGYWSRARLDQAIAEYGTGDAADAGDSGGGGSGGGDAGSGGSGSAGSGSAGSGTAGSETAGS